MTTPLLGCIADDFTGATDLANTLVRAGIRTLQVIGIPEDGTPLPEADAIVVSLKSRTVPAEQAVALSLQAMRWLQARGVRQLYFKYCSTFDSTPSGNIGPVTDALLDALHGPGQGITIVCPAFPANQRTVYKGHLFVGDVLLSDSGMRQHPLTPMTDANLVRVMQAQSRRRVGLVPHETVRQGHAAVAATIARLQAEGFGVAVVDAIADEDLLSLGHAVDGMQLVTGGSGVALGLPPNWLRHGVLDAGGDATRLPAPQGRRAVVSGSCSQATQAQVQHAVQQGHAAFAVDPLALAGGQDVVRQALDWAAHHIEVGPVLVYATATSADVRVVQERLGTARAGELVEQALSAIAVGLVRLGVGQMIVAGGETSGAVVQALGISELQIGPQIDPGVPWTCGRARAVDGAALHLALKSGNFGSPAIFSAGFARLEAA